MNEYIYPELADIHLHQDCFAFWKDHIYTANMKMLCGYPLSSPYGIVFCTKFADSLWCEQVSVHIGSIHIFLIPPRMGALTSSAS